VLSYVYIPWCVIECEEVKVVNQCIVYSCNIYTSSYIFVVLVVGGWVRVPGW